jgi:hypothetical protein
LETTIKIEVYDNGISLVNGRIIGKDDNGDVQWVAIGMPAHGELQRIGAGSVQGLLADVSRAVWYASLRRGPGFETR